MLILPFDKILTSVEEDLSSQDIAASPICSDPFSDLCLSMSQWMEVFFESHSLCSKDSNRPLSVSHEKRLPTRVLDVGWEGPEVSCW